MSLQKSLSSSVLERYTTPVLDNKDLNKEFIDVDSFFNTFTWESSATRLIKHKIFKLLKMDNIYDNFNIVQCFINKYFYGMDLPKNMSSKINLLISENPEMLNFIIV